MSWYTDNKAINQDQSIANAIGHRPKLSNPLERPSSMAIERILLRVVDTPPAMYRRPLSVSHFDGMQQNYIADRVVTAMGNHRTAGTLTRSSFAGTAGGFMRPTAAPVSVIEDYASTFVVLWMWVRRGSGNFSSQFELVCARTHAESLQLDFMGRVTGIYPDAEFTVNNVVMLNIRHTTQQGVVREDFNFSAAADFVADPNYRSINDSGSMIIQSPSNALYGALANRAGAPSGGRHSLPTSAMVTATPKVVPSSNAVPAQFIATAANAFINGTYSSDSTGIRDDAHDPDEYDASMAASRMSDAAHQANYSPLTNGFRFQQAMANLHAATEVSRVGLYGGMFTWGDLVTLDDRLRNFESREADRLVTVVIPDRLLSNNRVLVNQRYNGYGSEWAATSEESSACTMLINMVLVLMFEIGLSTVNFNVTNMTRDGRPRCALRGDHDLNFIAQVATSEADMLFCTRMENEIFPEIAAAGDGTYHEVSIACTADVLGDVWVRIQMNGNNPEERTLPASFSNQYGTQITTNQATLTGLSNTLSSITDAVSELRQQRSLAIAGERIPRNVSPYTTWAK